MMVRTTITCLIREMETGRSTDEELMISNGEGHLFAYYPYNETISNMKQLPIVVDDKSD